MHVLANQGFLLDMDYFPFNSKYIFPHIFKHHLIKTILSISYFKIQFAYSFYNWYQLYFIALKITWLD